VRVGLDRPHLFRMQIQSLVRGAKGRPLSIMFPMVTEAEEFFTARDMLLREVERLSAKGYPEPERLRIGLMLEVPSLVYAPDSLYETADFISVGGNDLMQFFFAADRENERVRQRYDALNLSFLGILERVVERCAAGQTRLSFCGEVAGRPVDAIALAAIGFRELSVRSASIGPLKQALLDVDLGEVRAAIEAERRAGVVSARNAVRETIHRMQRFA
jgi:phosphotransferase system enzyme I (PtsP)